MNIMIEPEIEDYRGIAYRGLLSACAELGAKVHLYRVRRKLKKKRRQYLKFPVCTEKIIKSMDAVVVFSPYATSHNARRWCLESRTPLLHLEKGFLPSSTLCDIGGFWGESSLSRGIDLEKYNTKSCHEWSDSYSNYLISNNLSKNTQPDGHSRLTKDFVFLPMQYMNDQSVLRFGNMPYPKFLKLVTKFCRDHKVILALKKHPKAYFKEPKAVDAVIKRLRKRFGNTLQVVDGSIHWFCKNCLFMAGMNTGSILDGLVNHCVISHCGKSIYMNSGAVIHDDNVIMGLETCISMSPEDRLKLFNKQRSLLYFLYHHYLLLEDDTYNSVLDNKTKIINQLKKIP